MIERDWKQYAIDLEDQLKHIQCELRQAKDQLNHDRNQIDIPKASDEQLADFLNSTSDGFFALDQNWRFLFVNHQFAQVMRRRPEELMGKIFWEVFPAYVGTIVENNYRQVMQDRTPMQFEIGGIYSSSWFEISVYPTQDGISVFSQDRTEEHQIEESLCLSEEKFSIAFANNPAAIALTRLEDGKFLDVNHTWESLLGYSRVEAIGQSARKMNIWPNAEKAAQFVQTLRDKGSLQGWEQEFYHRSGKPFVAQLSAQLLTVQGEQLILSTLIDITELKQTEAALRESEESERLRVAQLEAVFTALPIGLAITNEKGGTIQANTAYHQIWGGEPPETNSVKDYKAYRAWWVDSGQVVNNNEWASAQAVQHGRTVIGQKLKLWRFDGKYAYVLNSASPVLDAQGKIIGSAVAIQDITMLRYAEQALKEANETLENKVMERTRELSIALESLEVVEEELRVQNEELERALVKEKALRNQLIQSEKYAALARLIASVAHEIQNPLQTVRNSLYLLKGMQTAETREILDMAYSESNRMSTLVQQLREAYRPADVEAVDFTLSEVLVKVRRLLDPQFRQNKVEWVLDKPEHSIRIHGVPDRIQQVFMNICLNATDAMGERGGLLKVRLSQVEERACIAFQDTGPGIRAENLEKIFEPFFTTKEKGTGLGLAICYEIIKDHGGEITVESTPGAGATFKVYLPIL